LCSLLLTGMSWACSTTQRHSIDQQKGLSVAGWCCARPCSSSCMELSSTYVTAFRHMGLHIHGS
jgi:hypothetical protein